MFELDQQLEADTHWVANLPLSELRLMDNQALPWLILVPRKPGCVELTDLEWADQQQLLHEVNLCHALLADFAPDKINSGAIGNVVSQLHIHVLARYRADALWPAPVWGQIAAAPYDKQELESRLAKLRSRVTEELA